MPLFEYQCSTCGYRFEFLASNSTMKPDACPKCGNKNIEKQLSAFKASTHEGYAGGNGSSCSTGCCPFE